MDPSVYGYGVQKRPLDDGGKLPVISQSGGCSSWNSSMETAVCFQDGKCSFLCMNVLYKMPCAVYSYLDCTVYLGIGINVKQFLVSSWPLGISKQTMSFKSWSVVLEGGRRICLLGGPVLEPTYRAPGVHSTCSSLVALIFWEQGVCRASIIRVLSICDHSHSPGAELLSSSGCFVHGF